MNDQTKISLTLRVLFAVAALGLALAFMRVSADMLNALILAWIIVLVASPLLHWLRSKEVPTWLVFGLTLVAILAVFLTLILFMIIALNKFAEALPAYFTEYENLVASVEDGLA
jgi:predicted PurR-regulated permease PerM